MRMCMIQFVSYNKSIKHFDTNFQGGNGTISDWLTDVYIIDGEGETRSYSVYKNEKDMKYLSCCLGMCGIIYKMMFKVPALYLSTSLSL